MTAVHSSRTTGPCGPDCGACADLRSAAVALIGAGGLDAVTPARLANLAGLPEPALARHACGDVGTCVAEAYREAVEDMQARFAARLRAAGSRDAALHDATRELLAHLAGHPDCAAFVAVEVFNGGRRLLELREELRRRSVADVRRELARFDGGEQASEVQIEMLVAGIGHMIARHVRSGQATMLPELIEPALAMADACEPLPA